MTETPTDPRGAELSSDGRTRVKIVIPDDHSMVSLLGSRDELLHVIEGAFGADIHVRGNEITVTGSPEETQLVARLFEELTQLLASGADPGDPGARKPAHRRIPRHKPTGAGARAGHPEAARARARSGRRAAGLAARMRPAG